MVSFEEALAVSGEGEVWRARIHEGYDVFGIPHGGYLAALAGHVVLEASGAPDLFTMTTHFLRKAAFEEMRFDVRKVGGSRRFTSYTLTGTQRTGEGEEVVLSVLASVGDRAEIEGPTWMAAPPRRFGEEDLTPVAGPEMAFPTPRIAQVSKLRLDRESTAFAGGELGDRGALNGVVEIEPADQLAAIVACDVTPPAVWNVLGSKGWVPTVELTAHVRARPVPGPMSIEVETRRVSGGFLEEDALVFDAEGALVVQSRQLARWTS